MHIYKNHFDAVDEQLNRVIDVNLPTLKLNKDIKDITDFRFSDIKLNNYFPQSKISAEIAV